LAVFIWTVNIAASNADAQAGRKMEHSAIASHISKPPVSSDQPTLEVDELWTYIGHKGNEYWLAYALEKATRKVVDFVIGKRTEATWA
jgi:hypothetical protein